MSDTTKDAVQLTAELASMTRMFHAACADLGAINEALGLDPDDGGASPIIDAIAELKAALDARGADQIDPNDLAKLPELARTAPGKRLYAMAYARGRARERLNASGKLRPAPRAVVGDESARQEMRLMLPEGGHVNLFWPDELTADSALMLSEMFSTVMQAFARAAAAKIDAAPAASGGERS